MRARLKRQGTPELGNLSREEEVSHVNGLSAPGVIHLERRGLDWYSLESKLPHGGVAERSKAPVVPSDYGVDFQRGLFGR